MRFIRAYWKKREEMERRRGGKIILERSIPTSFIKLVGTDLSSITKAAENRTIWKGIVVRLFVVHKQPGNVMGYIVS